MRINITALTGSSGSYDPSGKKYGSIDNIRARMNMTQPYLCMDDLGKILRCTGTQLIHYFRHPVDTFLPPQYKVTILSGSLGCVAWHVMSSVSNTNNRLD